ncbi:MAG TPA: hypothetical protein ENI73_06930 [Spirochaetes bacterium]|nr:hypothetical protein [Spirochaetota bacterium]
MKMLQNLGLLIFLTTCFTGCDQLVNKIATTYLKSSLKDTCGEDDPACIAAVEKQFDTCHKRSEKEWDSYINSSSSNEDKLLEIYSEKMYSCIVNDKGEPYFYYNPE